MTRRSRSNDGTPSHVEAFLPISQRDLGRLLAIFKSEPRPPFVPQVFHGPKASRGHPPTVLSDEQVLAIRKMHGWHGMKRREIVAATGLSKVCIDVVVGYRNRVHLDPGPRPTALEA